MADVDLTPEELEGTIRDYALTFPEAHIDHPWGETVIKVRKKIFLFYGIQEGFCYVGVKLPPSHQPALTLPWAELMGYGLGKAGWVGGRVPRDRPVPLDMLKEWVEESYRAVAPKTLSARLPGQSFPQTKVARAGQYNRDRIGAARNDGTPQPRRVPQC